MRAVTLGIAALLLAACTEGPSSPSSKGGEETRKSSGASREALDRLEDKLKSERAVGNSAEAQELADSLKEILFMDGLGDALVVEIVEGQPRHVVILVRYKDLKEFDREDREGVLEDVQDEVEALLDPSDKVFLGVRGKLMYGLVASGTPGGKWRKEIGKVVSDEPLAQALANAGKSPAPSAEAKAPAKASGKFTGKWAQGRVRDLNDLCPDTFCEGEFDYRFKTLTCTDATCELAFEATRYSSKKKPLVASVKFDVSRIKNPVEDVDGEFDIAVGEALIAWETKSAR